jgi:hypothetical protein
MHACKQPPRCSDCVSVGCVVLCPISFCLVLMHSAVFGACLRGSVESWQANPSSSSRTVNLYSNAPLVGLTLNGAPVLDAERMPKQVCVCCPVFRHPICVQIHQHLTVLQLQAARSLSPQFEGRNQTQLALHPFEPVASSSVVLDTFRCFSCGLG